MEELFWSIKRTKLLKCFQCLVVCFLTSMRKTKGVSGVVSIDIHTIKHRIIVVSPKKGIDVAVILTSRAFGVVNAKILLDEVHQRCLPAAIFSDNDVHTRLEIILLAIVERFKVREVCKR